MAYHLAMLLQQYDAGRVSSLIAELACAPAEQGVIQISRYR